MPAACGPLLDGLTGCRAGAAGRAAAARAGAADRLRVGDARGGGAGRAAAGVRSVAAAAGPGTRRRPPSWASAAGRCSRWVAALRSPARPGSPTAAASGAADPLGGVDERWLAMCRLVLAEHTEASRPTKELVLRRVSARLAAEHGAGHGAGAGRRRASAVLAELARGTNAFTGSTKAKRSIAARPQGVYGRLRPTRPGEYLLLDTTPLDVFAMEPVTLRWVRCELTIAMDLYSRCITGLRLSPVVDQVGRRGAGAVRDAASRVPAAHQRRPAALCGPAGRGGDRRLPPPSGPGRRPGGRPGGGGGGDRRGRPREDLPVRSPDGVCERLGISVQPARPLTPTDKAAVERFFRTLSEGLLAALPGYKGPDVYSRGADPEGCAYFFTSELEQVIREWISGSTTAGRTPGWPSRRSPGWSCRRRRCSPTGPPARGG